jgi:hypothetical protein
MRRIGVQTGDLAGCAARRPHRPEPVSRASRAGPSRLGLRPEAGRLRQRPRLRRLARARLRATMDSRSTPASVVARRTTVVSPSSHSGGSCSAQPAAGRDRKGRLMRSRGQPLLRRQQRARTL